MLEPEDASHDSGNSGDRWRSVLAMRRSYTPALRATYRVQLHAAFTLQDAIDIVPYLDALGVSHLYASPILAARRGSMHGYDVIDPRRINPELGGENDVIALAAALHDRGMGLIVDIVPNHMGIGPENAYWQDVLAHGRESRYARWFDIAWDMHPDGKVVVPFLADESAPPEEHAHYRLVHWKKGGRGINYRRFFDVNDLAALRMEDPEVFAETHEYIFALIERATIDGLRVDHIDGLRHPRAYLARVREETDRRHPGGIPIFVEKILMGEERLRASWPVDGTTGYERLNDIDDLFIDPEGFARLEARYRARRRSKDLSFAGVVRADKRAVLDRSFAADVERLSRLLTRIISRDGETPDRRQVLHGIEEFIAAFPVYRTYIEAGARIEAEDRSVLDAMELVEGETIANRIRSLCCHPEPRGGFALDRDVAEFIERMQQLTGPATAKGLEDTAHYGYIPLASRNEVGGAPDRPLDNIVGRFHDANHWYAAHFPHSLVTTSTHDTKRSGDVRARISALSEIDREWERSVARWRRLNRKHQKVVRGRIVPDPNAELLVYQTLVGIWPAPRAGRRAVDVPERQWRTTAVERMKQYVLKAVREAKLRTSWTDPDQAYEKTLLDFVAGMLDAPEDDPFLSDVSRLVARVAPLAQWNSLSRILLHLTMPGTPDLYQGDEAWNFTLVDPDNRRAVNYSARQSSLGAADAMHPASVSEIPSHVNAKMWMTHRILEVRRKHERLFGEGEYRPLITRGPRARHIVAFERRLDHERAIIVAPRLLGSIVGTPAENDWRDTSVQVDPGELSNVLTGAAPGIRDGRIEFEGIPFALLMSSVRG
jgi:(1->4)-alpha-D-glucan 1-alpha-D-glucosylmutase